MDARTAAHALAQIAAFLELTGENQFKVRAYRAASRSVRTLNADDLGPLLRSGELARLRGLGPATLTVIRDLVEHGESRYLAQLREAVPESLLELLSVPGLSVDRIHRVHAELGVASLADLERAARAGQLARLKGIGPKTAAKILAGIDRVRSSGVARLYVHAVPEAAALLAAVRSHPDVAAADIAGSVRRGREVVRDVDIVAACTADPAGVARSFTRIPGLRDASDGGTAVSLHFVDGAKLDLYCVEPADYAVALWRATGTEEHVSAVRDRLANRGLRLEGDALHDARGGRVSYGDEQTLYAAAGLEWIPPELREHGGEIDAASRGTLPALVRADDIRGVLHCHSTYSDGKDGIAEMARAARARGWSYLGISDHSQAAFYASGVSREMMLEQHDAIDELNATLTDIRILKGVEADILADGRLDYDEALLDRFDYVIASIHSRFKMDGPTMTARVLRAMDDPHTTILAHPTGRLLLSREPYALDVDAVLEKAAETGVAIELNADPRRLDLDWRYLRRAKELGVAIEIGPDAHSRQSLDYVDVGVMMARKGWLEPGDVLNTRDASGVLAFAAARRQTP